MTAGAIRTDFILSAEIMAITLNELTAQGMADTVWMQAGALAIVAVVVTLGRMYRDSEMVIWFASGLSLTRFVRPVLRTCWPVLVVVVDMFRLLLPHHLPVPFSIPHW